MSADNFVVIRKRPDGYWWGNFSASQWWSEEYADKMFPDDDFQDGPFPTELDAMDDAELKLGVIEYGFENDREEPTDANLFERIRDHIRWYRCGEVDDTGTRLLVELFAALEHDLKTTGHGLSDAAAMYRAEAKRQKARADELQFRLDDRIEFPDVDQLL